MSETRIYRGYIAEHDSGEATKVLFLTGVDEPLAEAIEEDMVSLGRYLSVHYYISDTERSVEEMTAAFVMKVMGDGEVTFGHHYSEITGYLWTDEEIVVGGHDLLEELRSHKGLFAHLEIAYSKTGERPD